MKILFLLSGWLALCAARELWLRPVNDSASTNSGESRAEPFRSVAALMAAVAPGDVVRIVDGTYAEPLLVTASGTADAPITIAAESFNGVTFDVQVRTRRRAPLHAVRLTARLCTPVCE